MTDKALTDLPDGGAAATGDIAYVVRSGNSRRATLGSAAAADTGDFATAAQGSKADTAVQPGDLGNAAARDVGTGSGDVAAGNHTHSAATTSVAGFMSAADKSKLNGIETGAQVNPGVATTSANGLMSSSDKTKLNGIAAGATANTGTVTSVAMSVPTGFSVTGAITTSGTFTVSYASGYQGYTTAEASKLSGIQAGAQVNTVTSVAGKTGAVTLAKGDVGLGNVDNTSNATERAAVKTLTNTRITPRIGATASGGTITANADNHDQYNVTALATASTIAEPAGAPTDGQKLIYRLKDNGTARALSWNAIFRGVVDALPGSTTLGKVLYCGFLYNGADSKWDLVALAEEA